MSDDNQFALDANVFIQAHQKYYRFAICPGFWAALLKLHEAKRVVSIDKVKTELVTGNDQLSRWVKAAPKTFFKGTADIRVVNAYRDLARWVQVNTQFTPEAKEKFASVADGWLIAYAMANGLVVVTHEEHKPEKKTSVPMPNVCLEFNVEYCNTFEMLELLKVKFVLGK